MYKKRGVAATPLVLYGLRATMTTQMRKPGMCVSLRKITKPDIIFCPFFLIALLQGNREHFRMNLASLILLEIDICIQFVKDQVFIHKFSKLLCERNW